MTDPIPRTPGERADQSDFPNVPECLLTGDLRGVEYGPEHVKGAGHLSDEEQRLLLGGIGAKYNSAKDAANLAYTAARSDYIGRRDWNKDHPRRDVVGVADPQELALMELLGQLPVSCVDEQGNFRSAGEVVSELDTQNPDFPPDWGSISHDRLGRAPETLRRIQAIWEAVERHYQETSTDDPFHNYDIQDFSDRLRRHRDEYRQQLAELAEMVQVGVDSGEGLRQMPLTVDEIDRLLRAAFNCDPRIMDSL